MTVQEEVQYELGIAIFCGLFDTVARKTKGGCPSACTRSGMRKGYPPG